MVGALSVLFFAVVLIADSQDSPGLRISAGLLKQYLAAREADTPSVCLIGRHGGQDVAVHESVLREVRSRFPNVQGYPECAANRSSKPLWVRRMEDGGLHIGDGFCECSYRRRWRWFRFRTEGICLCE